MADDHARLSAAASVGKGPVEVLPRGEHVQPQRRSKYRESRMLVRRLCRLPGEDRAQYRQKVLRLREHFERFNVDTSELCQWFMSLRKHDREQNPDAGNEASFGPLGDFLLEPQLDGIEADEAERDRWRLGVFDDLAGIRSITSLGNHRLPGWLRDAMEDESGRVKKETVERLFTRLKEYDPAHRLVLLKSAAEWVVARYQRGMENWQKQYAAWKKEKAEWEAAHPLLTDKVRNQFTEVFKQLKDPERDDKPGLRGKRARICRYERMKKNVDDCVYAGEKGHGPLCWKYVQFVKQRKEQDKRFDGKSFFEIANDLAALCREHKVTNPANAMQSQHIVDQLYARDQKRKAEKAKGKKKGNDKGKGGQPGKGDPQKQKANFLGHFKSNWNAYLKAMGDPKTGATLNGKTAIEKGCLPHCRTIGGKVFEDSECIWNPHTDYCLEYKRRLEAALDQKTLELEKDYREWRRSFLSPPRRPSFKYPSARDLPMPKLFGDRFYEVDFENSIVRLRLDDMAEGEGIEFGFTPWPRGYSPSRKEIRDMVTSVHVNFLGSRARIGFRFEVEHRESRFGFTQDEIDHLRSQVYPRQAEDAQFLDAARQRLFDSFDGDAERDLRILAVDTGMAGAHAAVYEGRRHQADIAIPIHKFDELYTEVPEPFQHKKDNDGNVTPDTRGLRKEHIGRHLESIQEGAAAVAKKRQQDTDTPMQTLRDADFRGLKRHIRWMIRDWARLNARQIIDIAEQQRCDVIVFESLRGRRMPGYDKLGSDSERQKAEGVLYAYGRIRRKVTEKAVERGMRTVTAPYHKSSQVCHRCGKVQENRGLWRDNKRKGQFKCENKECKTECNSDANAARVLARVFLKEIRLPTL